MKRNRRKRLCGMILICSVLFLTSIPLDALAANSFQSSDTIFLNQTYKGALATKDDVNYYKFTTTGNDSFYRVELRNTEVTETIGAYLYSGDNATAEVYFFIANKESVGQKSIKLEPNHTYYIAIKNAYELTGNPSGNYQLSVTEIVDDASDNFMNSKSIPLNKKKEYSLDVAGDKDYFKFTTTSNDSYYKIELANTAATDTIGAYLYSGDDATTKVFDLTSAKAGVDSKVLKLQPKHTYYLHVENPFELLNESTGKYKLTVKEIKDDVPDSFEKSTKLSLNKQSTNKLEVDGDVDYFKFKTTKQGTYTITLSNVTANDVVGAIIYSGNSDTQNISEIKAEKAKKNSIKLKLKANKTYYIMVSKYYSFDTVSGSYSLLVKKN